jgi:hypothetical protein
MIKRILNHLTTVALKKRMEAFRAGYDVAAGLILRNATGFESPTREQLVGNPFIKGSKAAADDAMKVYEGWQLERKQGEQ